jgi:hypothetical protein
VKTVILPKATYRFNAVSIKIPISFFTERKNQSSWKHKRPQIANVIPSIKNYTGGVSIPDFPLYYRAVATKTI